MRKEILIRVQPDYDNGHHSKALKVAASTSGVESVTLTGPDRDLLLVIGDGVDEAKLAKKLKKEVGVAEIVELHTLPSGGADTLPPVASMVAALSPYHRHSTPSRSLTPAMPGGGELSCQCQQAGYCHYHPAFTITTPSPGHGYYPSPAAGPFGGQGQLGLGGYAYEGGGGGSSNAHAVSLSYPASYSPMVGRHGRRVGWGHRRGGKPGCCTIL